MISSRTQASPISLRGNASNKSEAWNIFKTTGITLNSATKTIMLFLAILKESFPSKLNNPIIIKVIERG